MSHRGVALLAAIAALLLMPQAASALMFTPASASPITADGMVFLTSTAGDFNGDGYDDLACVIDDGGQSAIYIGMNQTDGTFEAGPGTPFGQAYYIDSIRAADVNNDGDIDLLTSAWGDHWSVWLGDGTGSFGPAADSTFTVPPTAPNSMGVVNGYSNAIGDVDGDGDPDLVFGMYDAGFDVVLNDGDGNFTPQPAGAFLPPAQHGKYDGMYAPALGDFNGDGHLDLAAALRREVPNSTPTGIYLATGNGSGTFTPDGKTPQFSGRPGSINSMSAVKLNADSIDDLVAASYASWPDHNLLSVLGGASGLQPNPAEQGSLYAGNGPYQQATADFDRDGTADILVGIRGPGQAGIFRNGGDGTLSEFTGSPFDLPPINGDGFSVNGIYSGDFNGDGFPDIAGDSSHSDENQHQARGVDILISRPHATAPAAVPFGNIPTGSSSTQDVPITNDGAPPAYVGQATITGPGADQFSLGDTTCTGQLAAGGSCSRSIGFAPTSVGAKQATLHIPMVGQNDIDVALSGTGKTPPVARLSLKLSGAKKVKAGRTLVITARVTNTSGGVAGYGITLKTSVPGKLATKVKPVQAGDLPPLGSVTRKLAIKVKKTAKKGRKLKVTVTAGGHDLQPVKASRTAQIG